MTIVRSEHRAQFTIVPNAVFADPRLSVEAKGVLGNLLSRPHKWHVRLDLVGRTLLVGRKKLQRIFRELTATDYVTREAQRIVDGHRFGEIDYIVRDVPVPVDKSSSRPRGRKGPAYKELDKNRSYLPTASAPDGWPDSIGGQKHVTFDAKKLGGIEHVSVSRHRSKSKHIDRLMRAPMPIPVFFVVSIPSKRQPGAPFANSGARAPDWTAMAHPILPSRGLLLRCAFGRSAKRGGSVDIQGGR